ncbi:MAG: DsbA family protein [Terracidiphilus sp.]
MIRLSVRLSCALALVALSLPAALPAAQQTPAVPAAQKPPEPTPAAPAPSAAPAFPKPSATNFTAAAPSKELVNAFLQTVWGYDPDRIWQVQAILKTQAEGVSQVIILVADKSGKQKPAAVEFFVLPDEKHIVAQNSILPFGADPYAEARATLQQRAVGPYRGSASKDLELVEFADFQCPHCAEAQANMNKLAVDFPRARIVFENFPLPQHPEARIAAAYGHCVAKLGGDDAFFSFAAAVYDGQAGLETPDGATLTLNSAVAKAGLNPAKVAACAAMPEAMAKVDASVKLAEDLQIHETPLLMINGRPVPANAPYETLRKIIDYQAKLDGVAQDAAAN